MGRPLLNVAVLLLCCSVLVSAVDWAKLTAQTMSQVPAREFLSLDATQLALIHDYAFAGLLPEQVREIPPGAFFGLQKADMENIKGPTCAAFKPEQSAKFNPRSCAGFTSECTKALSVQTISAFTSACVGELNWKFFDDISPQQFQAINPLTLKAIQCYTIPSLHRELIQAITPVMFANMASACCFLNKDTIHSLQNASLAIMSARCIETAESTIFKEIGPIKFSYIPKSSYTGITSEQAAKLDMRVLRSLTDTDLLEKFSGAAMVGLLTGYPSFNHITKTYGRSFIDRLTVGQVIPEDFYELNHIRDNLARLNSSFVVQWSDISDRLPSTNWLKVFLLNNNTDVKVFTDSVIREMMDVNFFGLKLHLFQSLPIHVFADFTDEAVRMWPPVFIEHITLDMFLKFQQSAFLELYRSIDYVPGIWIKHIPLQYIPHMDVSYLGCYDLSQLTAEQIAVMTPEQKKSVESAEKYCAPTPESEPVGSTTPESVPVSVPASIAPDGGLQAPVSTQPQGITAGGVFAIIFAFAVVIQGCIIGYHIYSKRRRELSGGAYDHL